jgi:2'-5' RNA ligase
MPSTLRAFIGAAIEPTPGIEQVLAALSRMGSTVRAVECDKLHLTLKFLGDVPRGQVRDIAAATVEIAKSTERMELRLIGLGAFPAVNRPSVVWVGLSPQEPLIALAGQLDQRLAALGFEPEGRPYRPHVTLARVKGRAPGTMQELILENEGTELGACVIGEITLFQSDLTPNGSAYSVLASAELRPSR